MPIVPMKGWYGSVILSFQRTPDVSTCTFLTRSGSGGFSMAVDAVPTRPPNSGMMQVVPAGCSPLVLTALRIQEGKSQLRGRAVLLARDDTAEGVFRFDIDDVARIDGQDRLGIGAVNIMERTLCRDRQFVAASRPSLGNA